MSSLGALTTTFTPPSSCVSSFSNTYKLLDNDALIVGPISPDACFPSNYKDVPNGYYSPGLFCPSGYDTACKSINTQGSSTETVITCCPTFRDIYTCYPNFLTVSGLSMSAYMGCAALPDNHDSSTTTVILTVFSNGTSVSTTESSFQPSDAAMFGAYGVEIRFQSTDSYRGISFTNSTSTFTDSLGLPSQGSILIINGSGGLSTRVRVGIGVGAAFGGIFALIVSSLVFRRWSLRQRSRRTINNNGDTGHSGIINIYPDAPNSESVAENSTNHPHRGTDMIMRCQSSHRMNKAHGLSWIDLYRKVYVSCR
ncbi:hypothetical protein V8E54_010043 [Elaphomyces granulatus]